MTDARKLAELTQMQRLKEQRCRGTVTQTAGDRKTRSEDEVNLRDARDRAGSALEQVLNSPGLCLDRMRLAAGRLVLAHGEHAESEIALSRAQDAEETARKDWQTTRLRADHLAERTATTMRHELRRAEDSRLANDLSLRAALKGRNRR